MQGNGNFTPIYKQTNKDVRLDKKRDKHSPKEIAKKSRKNKIAKQSDNEDV